MSSIAERKEALTHKTFLLMFRILVIFGVPAFAAYFLGSWLDTHFNIPPWGTLASLLSAFVFSWAAVLRMYVRIDREFKALAKEEQEHIGAKQSTLRTIEAENER